MEETKAFIETPGEPVIPEQISTIKRKPVERTVFPTRFASLNGYQKYQSVLECSDHDTDFVNSIGTTIANESSRVTPTNETLSSQKYWSESLTIGSSQQDELPRTKSRGDWKPKSLHSCAALIIALLLHFAAYCVARHYTQTIGIFLMANKSYDWVFRFVSSIFSVIILIWCTQISRDYASISPFLPENVSSQAKHKPRLYQQKSRIQIFSNPRPKTLIACAFLLVFCNSAILSKAILGENVIVNSASTSNKQFLTALASISQPPRGLQWGSIQGVSTKYREGWVVNDGLFIASTILHGLMICTILSLRMVYLPFERRWPRALRSSIGHRVTGLIRTPTTLVALAELFRAPEVRNIFQGTDSALPGQGCVVVSGKLSSLLLDHRVEGHCKRDGSAIELHGGDVGSPQLQMRSSLPKQYKRLLSLRHAFVPNILRLRILYATTLFVLLGLGLGAYLIVAKRVFYFWSVDSIQQTTGDKYLAWVQQLLFAALPLTLLTMVCLWWLTVDTFYRTLEPYARFSIGRTGRSSVCLDYSHISLLVLPFRAAIRGHVRLAWLAFILLSSCLVLVLPSGLFSYDDILIDDQRQVKLLQSPIANRYKSSQEVFSSAVFQNIAVQALFGSAVDQSWKNDNTVFPEVDFGGGSYDVVVDGLSAKLQCREVDIEFKPRSLDGSLSARLSDSTLGQFEWPDFCFFNTKQLATNGGQAAVADANACPTQKIQIFNTSVDTNPTSRTSVRSSSTTSSISTSTPTRSRNSTTATKPTISATASTRPGTTRECYRWYTPQPGEYCIEIAAQLGVNWTSIRDLNPDIDSECRNLQAGVPYCVDGVINSGRTRGRQLRDLSNTECTGWFYVPSKCTLNKSGFWLLVDAQGPFISTSKMQTGISSIARSTSMICVPEFLSNTIDVTITSGANLTILQNRVLASKGLDIGTWVSSDTGIKFNDFFGVGLIQNGFGGSYKQLPSGQILDRMSLLAASNSTSFTDGFRNFQEFQRIASHAFGLAFANIISRPISSDNATLLFEPVEPQSNIQPLTAQRHILVATVNPIPLYLIMSFLGLVLLSIPCAYLPKSNRTPLDPRHAANLIVNIYDSAFMQEVQYIVQRGGDPQEELKDRHFAFGVFEGISNGDKKLGIDFAERVTIINRRNRHVAEIDAEKMSIMSGASSQFPELAEGQTIEELEGRGDFDVPVVRLMPSRARWSRGYEASETGYQPVPRRVDSDNVVFQDELSNGGKIPSFGWLKGRKGKTDGTSISVRDVGTRSGSEETSLSSAVKRNWTGLINLMKGPLSR